MKTLYVQQSDLTLSLRNNVIFVKDKNQVVEMEISLNTLEHVMVFGTAQLTTQLLREFAKRQINVYYFTSYGKFLFFVDNCKKDDFEKQFHQAKCSLDEQFTLELSKKIISGKITNQINLLKSYDEEKILDNDDYMRLNQNLLGVANANSIAEILGFEGRNAKSYLYFLSLIVPDDFRFRGRSKRPSKDAFNCLLNIGYSILYSLFIGVIKKHGLSLGFAMLHQPNRHHATLASDLMEEWRPIIVDDTILALIKRGEIRKDHFERNEESAVILSTEGKKIFFQALRARMLEIHQYIDLDKKRYSFMYMMDVQLIKLIQAFEAMDPSLYTSAYTGE